MTSQHILLKFDKVLSYNDSKLYMNFFWKNIKNYKSYQENSEANFKQLSRKYKRWGFLHTLWQYTAVFPNCSFLSYFLSYKNHYQIS